MFYLIILNSLLHWLIRTSGYHTSHMLDSHVVNTHTHTHPHPWPFLLRSHQVFVHGDELENYYKEFDADILPSEFDGKGSKYDGKATAAKLFDWRGRKHPLASLCANRHQSSHGRGPRVEPRGRRKKSNEWECGARVAFKSSAQRPTERLSLLQPFGGSLLCVVAEMFKSITAHWFRGLIVLPCLRCPTLRQPLINRVKINLRSLKTFKWDEWTCDV